MSQIFEIIVFAEPSLSRLIQEGVQADPSIQFLAKPMNSGDLKRAVSQHGSAIVILEIKHHMLGTTSLQNIEMILKAQKNAIVAICDNVKDGFQALQEGMSGMLVKPDMADPDDRTGFIHRLKTKIRTIQKQTEIESTRVLKNQLETTFRKIIAIGSSTGGTESILQIVKELPANAPPVLIVQHMPPVFTKLLADRMNLHCSMTVWEAKDGDILRPGLVLLAPGDFQMTLAREGGRYMVKCQKGEKVNGHCPSVDMLFRSVAETAGRDVIGVILTGMGADGAKGLLEIRKKGGTTLGQDESSCVVYGMPKAAWDIGAVMRQVHLDQMSTVIREYV